MQNNFTKKQLDKLGDISIKIGKIFWQEDKALGNFENQVCILLKQKEKLDVIISELLFARL